MLSYISDIAGVRIEYLLSSVQLTFLRTHEGDAPFVALQVMPEVPWFRRLSVRVPVQYIVCAVQPSSSAELTEAVGIICRDAKLALIHRTITEGERAYYLRTPLSVRREDERLEHASETRATRIREEDSFDVSGYTAQAGSQTSGRGKGIEMTTDESDVRKE